jgi:predicted aspartyl protease
MKVIRLCSAEAPPRVSRAIGLFVVLVIQSGTLIKSAVAQSRNVDGTFLVETRINGTLAVLAVDTGAEHSLLDREFAQRLGLRSVEIASIQRPDSAGQSEVVLVTDLDIQSVHSSSMKMMTDDFAAMSRALGAHIDGALGNDVLRNLALTLNYSAGSVTFGPTSAVHHGIPIRLGRIGNRYFVPLRSDGVPLNFLLDTGTNFSVLSSSGWSRMHQNKQGRPTIDGVRSSGTSTTSKLVCIHQMSIGRASYENLPMRVQPRRRLASLQIPTLVGYWAAIS